MIARGSFDLLGPSTKLALEKVRAGEDPRTTGSTGTTNGAAMRVAPVGIAYPFGNPTALGDAVHESCMVTHDTRFARHADRTIHLFDGGVVEETQEATESVA